MRARSAVIALAVVATLVGGPPHTARAAEWVFFRDHVGASTEPDSFATARALARREKAWAARAAMGAASPRLGAEADAPPAPTYLAALAATGARLRVVSRWLNAASVDADPTQLAAIRALPRPRPRGSGERASVSSTVRSVQVMTSGML